MSWTQNPLIGLLAAVRLAEAELDAGLNARSWGPLGRSASVLAGMRPAFVVGLLTPVGVAAAVVWLDLILGWLGLPGYLR